MSTPPLLVQRARYLRDICRDRDVLHLGCTNWPFREQSAGDDRFIHFALTEAARELWGVDDDEEGLCALRDQGIKNLFAGDLENLEDVPIDRTFEIIVAGEVIEHLPNPGLFLTGVRRFMRSDTVLVITTVNAYCLFRLVAYAAAGHEGLREPVHPDHVSYYSRRTLEKLLEKSGLRAGRFLFYDIGNEHRPFVPRKLKLVNDIAVRFAPQLADGVILECRLACS